MVQRTRNVSTHPLPHSHASPGVGPVQAMAPAFHQDSSVGTSPPDYDIKTALLDLPRAQSALGIGRSSLFELLRAGHLPAVKVGRRTLIRTSDLRRFIANLASAQYRQPHITPKPKRGQPYER